jgi:hypothetical protein
MVNENKKIPEINIISNRVSFSETEKKFVLVIIPERNRLKMYLLFFWLLAWTVGGIYIMLQSVYMPGKKYKIFAFIYFFFWLYFEGMVVKVFHWRKWGKEVLVIENGKVIYEKNAFIKNNRKILDLNIAKDCEIISLDETKWQDFFTTSFWHIGKERLRLSAGAKEILFGFQLNDKEAKESAKKINRFMKLSQTGSDNG